MKAADTRLLMIENGGVTNYAENRHGISEVPSQLFLALLLSALVIYSSPASAEYSYHLVSPPDGVFTQGFGINNSGTITGMSQQKGIGTFSYMYNLKRGEYTRISNDFHALDISNAGVMVGSIDRVCAIRDKRGSVTTFFPPSYSGFFCTARGVNSKGKISGYDRTPDGRFLGFIYDSNRGTYEEFLPSRRTIPHAINNRGQNVGSVRLDADGAFPGSAGGDYGYLRQADGSVKFFSIMQSYPGLTRARGISESGLVAGFYFDADTSEFKSFVTTVSNGTEFESIALTADQVVHQKPCNTDSEPPGPGYDLYTDMSASQIRNDGVVVGSCLDLYYNKSTGIEVSFGYGFIAIPEHQPDLPVHP